MISRYSQIQQQGQVLSGLLRSPGHVQKIHSTAWYLCLQVRLPGKTFYLYLGRGGGHEGLWTSSLPTPAPLRLRDTWLEWCRKNLSSALLLSIDIDPHDRAFRLNFGRGGEISEFYVLYAGRTTFFAFYDGNEKKWFVPWGGAPADGFDVFNEVGRKLASPPAEVAPPYPPIEDLLKLEAAFLERHRTPKAKLKSLKTKIEKIEGDLVKIRQWPNLQSWIEQQDPASYENSREVVMQHLKYKFPQGLNGWQKRDWLFGQVKRLKLAEAKQVVRLHEAQEALEKMHSAPQLEESTLRPIKPIWRSVAPDKVEKKVVQDEYDIHSYGDCRIGVGKSAQGNDQLRKTWASGDDWWVHSLHGTSAHAIIKLPQVGLATPEQIKRAAVLIAKRSGSRASQLEVVVTMVKNVRGVPGAAGMVTYKKNKTLLCDVSEG